MRLKLQLDNLNDRVRSSLWFAPTIAVIAAGALLAAMLWLDTQLTVGGFVAFGGTPSEARDVASTIAAAMLGFIGIVFTVTIVALQLASGQFSPRVLRTFLRDRLTKITLGLFVATFTYSLMLIKFLDAGIDSVPDITFDMMFVMSFLCIGVFIAYIDGISQSLRVVTILESVARETRETIDRVFPDPHDDVAAPVAHDEDQLDVTVVRDVVHRRDAGVIVSIDAPSLVEMALEHDVRIELHHGVGDFVRHGALFAVVRGEDAGVEAVDLDALSRLVAVGAERTMQQDVEFGFRQLVDIAERALSPGINDPTTAVQAIDRLHDLLARITVRPLPGECHRDDSGRARVQIPVRGWEDYFSLAVDAVRLNAGVSLQVYQRLRGMLVDLQHIATGTRAAVVSRSIEQLDATARGSLQLDSDVSRSQVADSRG